MKDYNKNKKPPFFKYCNVNKWCGCAMSQKMPLNDFKWTEDISEIDESFIKSYNEESGIFNT